MTNVITKHNVKKKSFWKHKTNVIFGSCPAFSSAKTVESILMWIQWRVPITHASFWERLLVSKLQIDVCCIYHALPENSWNWEKVFVFKTQQMLFSVSYGYACKSDVQFPQGFRFAYIVLAYSPASTLLLRWRNPLSGGAVEPCLPVAVYRADYPGSSCPEPLGYVAAPQKCCYGGIFLMAWLILQCPAHEGPSCFLHGSKEWIKRYDETYYVCIWLKGNITALGSPGAH